MHGEFILLKTRYSRPRSFNLCFTLVMRSFPTFFIILVPNMHKSESVLTRWVTFFMPFVMASISSADLPVEPPKSSVDAFLTWSRSTSTSRQFFVCLQMSSFTMKAKQNVHGRKSSTGFSWLGRLSTMRLSPVVRASILCLKLPLF